MGIFMEISEQERQEKAKLFDLLVNHYGAGAKVLNRRNHTNVFSNETGTYDIRGIDEKFLDPDTGRLLPQALKHWTLLDKTLDYLRIHHNLFASGNVYTTCPIHPWFGKTPTQLRQSYYQNKFRAYIQYIGSVAFTCDSWNCKWEQCRLNHKRRTKKKNFWEIRFDIFNLMQILDSIKNGAPFPYRKHELRYYSNLLAAEWSKEVSPLKSGPGEDRGGEGYPKYRGHLVNKKRLLRALKTPTNNAALIVEFTKTLLHLINSSPTQIITSKMRSDEDYHFHEQTSFTIMKLGAAAKLWVYIWIRCEEAGRAIDLNIRDCERTLDIVKASYYSYRESLEKHGCLNIGKLGRISVSVLREKT